MFYNISSNKAGLSQVSQDKKSRRSYPDGWRHKNNFSITSTIRTNTGKIQQEIEKKAAFMASIIFNWFCWEVRNYYNVYWTMLNYNQVT